MTDTVKLGPYLLGPNDTSENGIYCGDARELAKAIPDESVDLIFTDPVYDRIDDYRWLAECASRVLKSSGTLLVWSNGRWHYKNTKWLDCKPMVYQRTFAVTISNRSAPMDGRIIAKTNKRRICKTEIEGLYSVSSILCSVFFILYCVFGFIFHLSILSRQQYTTDVNTCQTPSLQLRNKDGIVKRADI